MNHIFNAVSAANTQNPARDNAGTIVKSKGIKYEFAARPWQYNGPGGWHFISLPKNLAKEIRKKENLSIDKEVEAILWI